MLSETELVITESKLVENIYLPVFGDPGISGPVHHASAELEEGKTAQHWDCRGTWRQFSSLEIPSDHGHH